MKKKKNKRKKMKTLNETKKSSIFLQNNKKT